MKKYIYTEAFKRKLIDEKSFFPAIVARALEEMPDADVVEAKHGEWIESYSYGCWHYDCPFCDDGFATKEKFKVKPNYCSNCGAKMDGGMTE